MTDMTAKTLTGLTAGILTSRILLVGLAGSVGLILTGGIGRTVVR